LRLLSPVLAPVIACACACACALIFMDFILSSQIAHFLHKKFQDLNQDFYGPNFRALKVG
jgi:hypothetical protein